MIKVVGNLGSADCSRSTSLFWNYPKNVNNLFDESQVNKLLTCLFTQNAWYNVEVVVL